MNNAVKKGKYLLDNAPPQVFRLDQDFNSQIFFIKKEVQI